MHTLKFLSILYSQLCHVVGGVYFAERLNKILGDNWKSFASQNYFDPHGLFFSTLWSGPLLVIAIIILVSYLLLLFLVFFLLSLSHYILMLIFFADEQSLFLVLPDC